MIVRLFPIWRLQAMLRYLAGASVCLALASCERSAEEGKAHPPASEAVVLGATPVPARLGEYAKTPYFQMRVLNSKPCAVESHFTSPPGTRKVAVEVELEASGDLEIPSNPFYAVAEDNEGRQYESTLVGCTPLLPAKRLTRGGTSRGWVTFDVPEGSQLATLVYQPAVIGISSSRVELRLTP